MLLAKIAAIVILVWFFHTARENEQEPFKWVIIGLIGFALTWEAAHLITDALTENRIIASTLPAIVATLGATLVRQKLLMDSKRDRV